MTMTLEYNLSGETDQIVGKPPGLAWPDTGRLPLRRLPGSEKVPEGLFSV